MGVYLNPLCNQISYHWPDYLLKIIWPCLAPLWPCLLFLSFFGPVFAGHDLCRLESIWSCSCQNAQLSRYLSLQEILTHVHPELQKIWYNLAFCPAAFTLTVLVSPLFPRLSVLFCLLMRRRWKLAPLSSICLHGCYPCELEGNWNSSTNTGTIYVMLVKQILHSYLYASDYTIPNSLI